MEVILLILAATYVISGKHSKETAQSAYKAGKEPPGLVKARLRHERGGGRFVTRPGTDKQQPKGPGATRLLIASRWANACDKSKIKGDDNLKRWRAWYEERAPYRDQAWRDKQNRKMDKRAERLDKWQGRWTSTKSAAAGAKDAVKGALSSNKDTESEKPAAETASEQPTQQPAPEPAPEPAAAESGADGPANPAAESSLSTTSNTTQQEGDAVYQSGASTMHNHADEVDGYEKALTSLGQDMQEAGWGAEVHGELADLHTKLQNVVARYTDLAETVKHQGDNVNDAYDAAPWSPDHQVLTQ